MTDETPPEKKEPDDKAPLPPRVPLRQRLKAKFNKAAQSDTAEMIRDTADDLRNSKKERVGLAAAAIIPGGFIGYYIHRRHQFKKKNAENDNADAPQQPKKQQPPKP